MTEIERRAVLDSSVACIPVRTPSIPPDRMEPLPFQIAINVVMDQLLASARYDSFQTDLERHASEKFNRLKSVSAIPAWTFGDCPHGIQFKDDDSERYSSLSECRHLQWRNQTAAGIPGHKPTDLTLQTHYAKSGDIQFKLIPPH